MKLIYKIDKEIYMLTDVSGVIFDLDGTLVDSMWMWHDIDKEFLEGYNIELPSDLQGYIEGMSFDETANYFKERFELKETIKEIQIIWNNMAWNKYATQVSLKEGVVDFLDHLRENNIPCGIASSNSKELIELIVEKYNMSSYFKTIRNSNEVAKGKPSPDIYLLVAKELGVEPENCLVFEDVVQGVLGGKNANMKVCNVYDEHSVKDKEKLRRLADYHIKSYHEIINGVFENLQYII